MTTHHASSVSATRPDAAPAFDSHYLEFFQCFNQQHFFEAHEVLELLWLPSRGGQQDLFYKGLIQLAGAFVHLRKQRLGPACALLRRARANLESYPDLWEGLNLNTVRSLIEVWLTRLERAANAGGPAVFEEKPVLQLQL